MTTDHLRQARVRAGLTQDAAATAVGVTTRTLRRWENGVTPLRRVYARALADLYGVDLDAPEPAEAVA